MLGGGGELCHRCQGLGLVRATTILNDYDHVCPFSIMGRHSPEQKRIKRRNQKKRKCSLSKKGLCSDVNQDLDCDIQGKTTTSELITNSGESVSCTTDSTCSSSCRSDDEASDHALFAALNRVGDDGDQYWEKAAGRYKNLNIFVMCTQAS